MTVAVCPRCQDEITIPGRGRPESRVQCPLCQEEMRLEEVLARVPPALILLDEEDLVPAYSGAAASAAMAGVGAGAKSAWSSDAETDDFAATDDYAVAGEESPRNDFLGGGIGAATSTMPGPGATIAAGPPRVKKQPNLIVEMVKMVVGGVVGLSLGMIVLWWLPEQYATDITGLGPTVAKYVPMIVPARFQGKKSNASPSPNNAASNSSPNRQLPKPMDEGNKKPNGAKPNGSKPNTTGISTNGNGAGNSGEAPVAPTDPLAVNDPLTTLDPLAMPADPNDPLAVADPLGTTPPSDDGLPTTVDPLATPDPMPAESTVPASPDETPKPMTEPESTTDPEPAPVDDTKLQLLADYVTAGEAAAAAFDGAAPADVENRKKLGTELFEAASQVGSVAAGFDPRDSAVAPVLEKMPAYLKSISNSPGKISMLGFLAGQRLDSGKAGEGIVCAGTVKTIRAVGKLYEMDLILASRDMRPVLVIFRENPQDKVAVDQKVLVTGAIVDDTTTIKGYKGSPGIMVLSGFLQPVE